MNIAIHMIINTFVNTSMEVFANASMNTILSKSNNGRVPIGIPHYTSTFAVHLQYSRALMQYSAFLFFTAPPAPPKLTN